MRLHIKNIKLPQYYISIESASLAAIKLGIKDST